MYPVTSQTGQTLGGITVITANLDLPPLAPDLECFLPRHVALDDATELLVPMATTGMIESNGDMLITWANAAFAFEFELSDAETAIGQQLTVFLPRLTSPLQHQLQVETKRGQCMLATYHLPAQKIHLHGTLACSDLTRCAVIQPIASQQYLESAIVAASQELNNTSFKEDFISTTSHEMRTPLNGVIGEVDNLEALIFEKVHEGTLSKEIFDAILDSLSIINSSAKIQLMLVDNMLSKRAH